MKWAELQSFEIDPMWSTMGPPGRDGVDGRPGADAKPAKNGRDGKDAASFNLRGHWNRTATYQPLDVVTHDGSSYVAVTNNNRNRPNTRSKVWQLLAAKGSKGDRGESTTTLARGPRGRDGKDGETVVVGNAPLEIEFAGNFANGQVIYIDGQAKLAQANSESTTGAVGFVIAAGQYLTEGQVTVADWTNLTGSATLTPGDIYYLSTNTAGSITNVAPTTPGTYVVALGRAIGPNTLDIEIQLPILLSGNLSVGSGSTQAIFDTPAEIGMAVYVSDSSHVDLAIANSVPQTNTIGLATAVGYLSEGTITKSDWSTVADSMELTPGDCYFLSASSPGMITNISPTAPGDYVVNLGRAVSETTLEIEIQPPILLTGNTTVGSSQTTETFTISATQAATGEIALAQSPSQPMVFLNGLLITDYEILGSTLILNCLEENDFVVVKY